MTCPTEELLVLKLGQKVENWREHRKRCFNRHTRHVQSLHVVYRMRPASKQRRSGPAREGVHAGGGLVQEDDGGVAQKGDGHAQLAPLPARQLPCPRARLVAQPCPATPTGHQVLPCNILQGACRLQGSPGTAPCTYTQVQCSTTLLLWLSICRNITAKETALPTAVANKRLSSF